MAGRGTANGHVPTPAGNCRAMQNSADAFRPAAKNAGWRKKEVFVPQVCRRFSMEVS